MNTFAHKLIKVVFWVLACLFGVILILTLPYIFLNSQLTKNMSESLKNKEYDKAMHLIGCYYDSEIAYFYEDKEKDVQLVLFRATPFVDTTIKKLDENGKETEVVCQDTIQLGYFGFLCNVGEKYNVSSAKDKEENENKTKLMVNDSVNIYLLDYDENQDTKADSILTLESGSFVTFAITTNEVETIKKIDFIDKEGNSFISINSLNLDFNQKFFKEFNDIVLKYNELSKNQVLGTLTDEEVIKEKTELNGIVSGIFEDNKNYQVGSYSVSIKDAKVKAYLIAGGYFIGILILGDLIVGRRIIVEIFKRLFSLFKKKSSKNGDS